MLGRRPTEPRQPVDQRGSRPGVPQFGARKLKPSNNRGAEGLGAYAPNWPSLPSKGPKRPVATKTKPLVPAPPTSRRRVALPSRTNGKQPRAYIQMSKMRDRLISSKQQDLEQISLVQEDVRSAMKIAAGIIGDLHEKKKTKQSRPGYSNPMFEYYRNENNADKRPPMKMRVAKSPRVLLVPAPPPPRNLHNYAEYASYNAVKRKGRMAPIDPYNAERAVEDALREYNRQNFQVGAVADSTIASLTSELAKTVQDCERTVRMLQRLEEEIVPHKNAVLSRAEASASYASPQRMSHNADSQLRSSNTDLGALRALLNRTNSNGSTSKLPHNLPNLPTQSMPVFSFVPNSNSKPIYSSSSHIPHMSMNNNLDNIDDEKSVLSEAQKSIDHIQKQLANLQSQ